MRFLYITFLALLAFCPPASAQRIRNYFDADSYNHTLSFEGYKAVFRLQSPQKNQQTVEMGVKYAWFSGNRINWTQGGYSGKLLDGPYTEFYESKALKTQGYFDMGLRSGEWKSWNEKGLPDSVVNYSGGKLSGRFERYDGQGNLFEKGKYRKGLVNGKLERHISVDSVLVTRYKNGKISPEKPSIIKIWAKKIFRKDKKQGDGKQGQNRKKN
jgi:hypothetical protein